MKLTSLALAAALSLSAGAGLAQPAPGPRVPDPAAHWQRPDPAQMAQRHAQMAQRHAQHLRDVLQLRPDQEPALQAFLAAMRPPADERQQMGREAAGREEGGREAGHPLTTPERLDRMQAKMAQHAERFRQRAETVRRFYAALSPAQQRAFDAMPMMFGPGMRGHGMRGHGMQGHGMQGHGGMHGGPGMPARPPVG
ncbi:MAG TPA: Spy/CpxP family protein refolding chaperone [Phenylobacterium sp.]|nr:Spy/CpxP family protein refolding chaperone [Phenylobacterium sp.]